MRKWIAVTILASPIVLLAVSAWKLLALIVAVFAIVALFGWAIDNA